MESTDLVCPLCCQEKFKSRIELRNHIDHVVNNLYCPECQQCMPSVTHLLLHLERSTCSLDCDDKNAEQIEHSVPITSSENGNTQEDLENFDELVKLRSNPECTEQDNCTVSVESDEDGHILIVSSDSASVLRNQNILAAQNEDGTILFTQVGSELSECEEQDALSAEVATTEEEPCELEQEIYSCNTCGVSFTSVMDHIQEYHSEQDVVVEMAEAETESLDDEVTTEVVNKRVITTSGDIIIEPSFEHYVSTGENIEVPSIEQEVTDKSGMKYTRRLVKIDRFWEQKDSTPKMVGIEALAEPIVLDSGETVNQVYNCRKCHYKSHSLEAMHAHECKDKGMYNCSQCDFTYNNPRSLSAHKKVHKDRSIATIVTANAEPVQTSFQCETCDTIFQTNKSLRLHKRMHDPVKARPIAGPVSYAERSDNKDMYHCKACDKLIHVGYREIHDEYHDNSTQYHCEICNRKFMSHDYLVMHMNVHNMAKTNSNKPDKGLLPYSCVYCHRQFARPHEKVKHERIHTGEKPHSCEICGKAFRVSYCLTLHMRTHTGARPYACPHCGKRFKAHSVYNHHLLTHSDVRAYKCPFCPKAFKTSVQLAGHKNSHTKPFSCKHCNRPFASLYAVRVHTETHRRQNNLKFSCKMCGASYARAFALKDHMKSVHAGRIDNNEFSSNSPLDPIDPITLMPKKERIEFSSNSPQDSMDSIAKKEENIQMEVMTNATATGLIVI